MPDSDEFHQYARECLASAADATTEAERKALLQMARTWTQAAMQIEATSALTAKPSPAPDPGQGHTGTI